MHSSRGRMMGRGGRVTLGAWLRSAVGATVLALGGCSAAATAVPAGPAPEPIAPELAEAVFDSAWARIHESYYDTTFAGLDWLAVRDELRPVARAAGTADSLRVVITGMLNRLGDSHMVLIPASVADRIDPDAIRGKPGEPGNVGLEVRVVEDELTIFRVRPGSVAAEAGVRPGWTIMSVDGMPAERLLQVMEAMPDNRRLAEARIAWAAESRLGSTVGDTVVAQFRTGDGATVDLRLQPESMPGRPVRFGNLPTMFADLQYREVPIADGCAGIIAFNVWMTPILPDLAKAVEALRHCDGMVLDLRGNPGGVGGMVMAVSGYFMDEQQPLGRLITRDNELSFVSMPRRVNSMGEAMEPYGGPLALLVDGLSMSTSEIFAAGLQEVGRARVFGEISGGQALPSLMVRLPNRDVLQHAFADLVTPAGVRIEGRGVVPDQVVALDRQALLAGGDPPLDAALEWIESRSGPR